MGIGLIFWMLMIIWALFGVWGFRTGQADPYYFMGSTLLLFVLFFLLGWHAFGFIVQGQ